MKPSSYFRIIEQQVYLDVNGPAQPSPEDVLLLRPLTPEELELYQRLKASARTDEQIYAEFVKRQAEARAVSLKTVRALKTQLVQQNERRLREPLPTLERMSTEDPTKLLLWLVDHPRTP